MGVKLLPERWGKRPKGRKYLCGKAVFDDIGGRVRLCSLPAGHKYPRVHLSGPLIWTE